MMNISQRQMEKMMKQMGIKSDEIDAQEVIIKTPDKELVIEDPQVTKINMHGQESIQVIGEIKERPLENKKVEFSDEDVEMIAEQTGKTEDEARAALEETGDIAEAIMKLKE